MAIHSLSSWENPYLTIEENGATLHVAHSSATASESGSQASLQTVALQRQEMNLRICDLPTALNSLPEDEWPYGRVVALEEEHDEMATSRPSVRRNVEATIKTLGDLGVVVYEWNDGSALH